MDVIYAIIAGLQSLIGKTPGQRRRNCRVALLGVSVVAIIAFSIYSVHASRKINVQVDAAKEEEPSSSVNKAIRSIFCAFNSA